MRASLISPRPTSTSDAAKPSCLKEKGSNDRPSRTGACNTTPTPHNINQQMRQILHSISPPKVPNYLTTDNGVKFESVPADEAKDVCHDVRRLDAARAAAE